MGDLVLRARQELEIMVENAKWRALLLEKLAEEIERLRKVSIECGAICPRCYHAPPKIPCNICGYGRENL